jgi:hypothetical protein
VIVAQAVWNLSTAISVNKVVAQDADTIAILIRLRIATAATAEIG